MYLMSISSKATFEPIHSYYNEDKRTAVFLLDKRMRDGEEYALGMRMNSEEDVSSFCLHLHVIDVFIVQFKWTAAVSTNGFVGVYETW